MAVYKIPISPSPQRFSIALGGIEYGLTVRYRNFEQPVNVVDIPRLANGLYPQYTESDIIAFSRDSVATYENAGGTVSVYQAGAPRVTSSGLVVEQGKTNKILYSTQFEHSSWTKAVSGSGVPPVVDSVLVPAPDGTLSARSVLFESGGVTVSDTSVLRYSPSGVSTVGAPISCAIWARKDGGTAQASLSFAGSGSVAVTITNQWQRFYNTMGSADTTARGLSFRTQGSLTGSGAVSIQLWGAMFVDGSLEVGSYIPTIGSAISRPDEIVAIGHVEQRNVNGGWVIDIADRTGGQMVNGIPLVTGCDLLAQHGHLGFTGKLMVQTDDNPDAVPTFANLGEQSHLYWITA
jgi:hypothetical protein